MVLNVMCYFFETRCIWGPLSQKWLEILIRLQ